mmetsp:Transcript_29242/g.95298  ORF Transcript_29242/g.95298 Transcript_29242/m.95298 type:complete len:109 (+) Transcript_29242:176-502(+)
MGPKSFSEMQERVDKGKFSEVGVALLVSPFSDVREALFYLPYALAAEGSPESGAAAEEHWVRFRERMILFDQLAEDAARYQAEDEDVQTALSALRTEYMAYIDALPSS